MSALQRCLYYSATLLNTDTKGTEPSVRITELSVLQYILLNMGTKGTEPSVLITEVSALQCNLRNTDTKGTVPSVLHYRGVCITVQPP